MDALKIALKSLDIGVGDEVIVPAHTYIATWLAVSNLGATPIGVDANSATLNIDVTKIKEKISSKTKAIIPVHMYGQACEMDEIMNIAKAHNLFVIEDFAQAQGTMYKGQRCGSIGHINGTSFYPSKNLGALGDGGAICTKNIDLMKKAKSLRNYGSSEKYINNDLGFNSRLDTIQAVVLNFKLSKLDTWNNERSKIAGIYANQLKMINEITLITNIKQSSSTYHLFAVKCKKRNELQQFLKANDIDTIIHYPTPPYLQKAYTCFTNQKGEFSETEKIGKSILSLPMYVGLKEEEINYVCDKIKQFYN